MYTLLVHRQLSDIVGVFGGDGGGQRGVEPYSRERNMQSWSFPRHFYSKLSISGVYTVAGCHTYCCVFTHYMVVVEMARVMVTTVALLLDQFRRPRRRSGAAQSRGSANSAHR